MKRRDLFSKIAAAALCVTMSAALIAGCGSGSDSKDEDKNSGKGGGKTETVEILTQFGEAGKKAGLEAISREVE